jgi:hypothetical protein
MSSEAVIDQAGTPKARHVYAVFESAELARAAIDASGGGWPEARILTEPEEAATLQGKGESVGLREKLERALKSFGGETNVAERYAHRLNTGNAVAVIPVGSRDEAARIAEELGHLGAYDLAYFGPWTMEFFHPDNARQREVPPQSEGDTTV